LVRFLYPSFSKNQRQKKTTEIVEDIEPDDSDNEDIAAAEEVVVDDQVEQDDDGQIEHDRETVKSSRDKAIGDMWAFYQVRMTPEEEKMALRIFPAVYISHSLMQYLNL
jgi:hypothetical protein